MDKREHLFELAIRLADDHLILGHRLSEWCGHAPMLEEDLSMPNMALDLIGQARNLYTYAAQIEGKGRDEDTLAYLRLEHEYRNLLLVERPNGDFAHTMLRQFYFSVFMELFWTEMQGSDDTVLAGIAQKAVKEIAYHVRHTSEWLIRLGDGTEESNKRMNMAVAALHGYCSEMFERDKSSSELIAARIMPDPGALRDEWDRRVSKVFALAKLNVPKECWPMTGGRSGAHGEEMGYILTELQYMQRTYPGMQW